METVNIDFGDSENYIPIKFLKFQYKTDTVPYLTEADLKYSESKRVTADEVIDQYRNEVIKVITKYLKELDDYYLELQKAYPAVVRMESILDKNTVSKKSRTTKKSKSTKLRIFQL